MFEDCILQSMRFPQKLWRIVNECKTGAIQWGANGDTILLDYKKFQAEYLDDNRPIFKTNSITSFIRQLNLYGFRKVISHNRDPIYNPYNPHVHEFLHDNFRAERMDLLPKVCRKTSSSYKSTAERQFAGQKDNPKKECKDERSENQVQKLWARSDKSERVRAQMTDSYRKLRNETDKCLQYVIVKNKEDNPRSETNCVSHLKQCQMELTKTLEQITKDYRIERVKREKQREVEAKENACKRIRSFQKMNFETVPVLCKIEFNDPSQTFVIKQNVEYPAFLPSNNVLSDQKTISSSGPIATTEKYDLHFNV